MSVLFCCGVLYCCDYRARSDFIPVVAHLRRMLDLDALVLSGIELTSAHNGGSRATVATSGCHHT